MRIHFTLWGATVTPEDINAFTGIAADTALLRGERHPAQDLPRQNLWSVESHVMSDSVAEHWAEIGPALTASAEILSAIASTGTARLTIAIDAAERLPSLQIPPAMAAFAGQVGALIDIDQIQQ